MITPANVEKFDIVLVDEDILKEVEQYVSACERCADNVALTLNYLLDALTGCDPAITIYLMRRPAHCPSCSGRITETTLVAV